MDPLDFARALLGVLSVGVLVLPLRWALFCFLLTVHVDITSPSFASATSVGFENAARTALLPLILLIRMRFAPFRHPTWKPHHIIWLLFTFYVAVASSWSDFKLSALKMIVYISMYTVIFAVLKDAWRRRLLDLRFLVANVAAAILLAMIHTYVLVGAGPDDEVRFTSFATPQYFAAYLVAGLAIVVFYPERKTFISYLSIAALVVATLLNGSRYVYVSMLLLGMLASLQAEPKSGGRGWRVRPLKGLAVLVGFFLGSYVVLSYMPGNRDWELLRTIGSRNARLEDVGTLAWRLEIYSETIGRIGKRSVWASVFGAGTSSGADVALDVYPAQYSVEAVDANRVLHNEYLRSLYEWGVLGFVLFVSFLASMSSSYLKRLRRPGGGGVLPFLALLPSILIGLGIENILAGAVSPAGVGILLCLSFTEVMVEPGVEDQLGKRSGRSRVLPLHLQGGGLQVAPCPDGENR